MLTNVIINSNSEVALPAITSDMRFGFFPVFIGETGYFVYDISNFK